ncbi:MAG: type II toxin-antitoxin system VapC family toxin [Deltaproteobacteria bacterium]|nr:type II toxin-antitoxin system VapC family toxin [Deltaproteobacteria bacterium]
MTSHSIQFIDANIIMYAIGGPHPFRDPCKKVLENIRDGLIQVVTNTEVLQEILYRFFAIKKPFMAESAYASVVQICMEILPVTLQDTNRALELLKTSPNILSRDAIHAATMINNDIREIISTDSHFDAIPEILRVRP